VTDYTFISYTHENTEFAVKLARHLRQRGVPVWLDQWNVPADEEWDRAITKALRGCSHCLVILSPPAIDSWVVREQVWQAKENGGAVISVLHQACDVPEPLQDTPCVDFTGRDYRTALRQLLRHYFPNQEIRVGYWTDLQPALEKARDNLALFWRYTLLPLLWPGWLGPVVVLSLIAIGLFFYWTRDKAEPTPAPSAETLAVVQPTSTPIPLPTPIITSVRATDGKVMVFVPAGEFLMGSAESDLAANDDEKPQHTVYLDEFWIDKTEITTAQYQQCIEAGICTAPRSTGVDFQQCVDAGICPPLKTEEGVSLENLFPVVGATWDQANAYCHWVGARLPTEAEWEKAARGTDGRIYPWGNVFDGTRVNFCDRNCVADNRDFAYDDGFRYVAPTGNFPAGASPYGALDMSGNVWEWTADWYDANAYSTSAYKNPTGPEIGLQRVIRGGSWSYPSKSLRVARRHREVPTTSHENSGFRCVMSEVARTQLQPEAPTSRRFWSIGNKAF